jgi:hypothetical protein
MRRAAGLLSGYPEGLKAVVLIQVNSEGCCGDRLAD